MWIILKEHIKNASFRAKDISISGEPVSHYQVITSGPKVWPNKLTYLPTTHQSLP